MGNGELTGPRPEGGSLRWGELAELVDKSRKQIEQATRTALVELARSLASEYRGRITGVPEDIEYLDFLHTFIGALTAGEEDLQELVEDAGMAEVSIEEDSELGETLNKLQGMSFLMGAIVSGEDISKSVEITAETGVVYSLEEGEAIGEGVEVEEERRESAQEKEELPDVMEEWMRDERVRVVSEDGTVYYIRGLARVLVKVPDEPRYKEYEARKTYADGQVREAIKESEIPGRFAWEAEVSEVPARTKLLTENEMRQLLSVLRESASEGIVSAYEIPD